ncbi:MAG: hypothetical protein H7098_09175 [Oligoflexus sp.]|nr:hypothetical protein [Pseudopedobacter sp.]
MNKQQILRKIGDIIQELQEQHQYLNNAKKISLLELELFTANSDFLIDHIEILKKLDLNTGLEQKLIEPTPEVKKIEEHPDEAEHPTIILKEHTETSEEQVFEDEEIVQPKKRIFDFSFDEQPTEMIFDFEKKIEVAEVFDRDLSEEEKEFLVDKSKNLIKEPVDQKIETFEEDFDDTEEEEIGEEPFLVVKSEEVKIETAPLKVESVEKIKPIIEEKPIIEPDKTISNIIIESPIKEEKRLTLNEMLSAKLGKNSVGNSGSKQITDLKSAISLNDKMVFIKELFNGYNLAYSEAIEIINRFETFDAADNFLQKNYSVKNDWSLKQSTVDRLYEYLNKKFVS